MENLNKIRKIVVLVPDLPQKDRFFWEEFLFKVTDILFWRENYVKWDPYEDNNDTYYLSKPWGYKDQVKRYQNPNPWEDILTGQVLFRRILEDD